MAICQINCSQKNISTIDAHFKDSGLGSVKTVEIPISSCTLEIDLLVVEESPLVVEQLAASMSDWNVPPATLFLLKAQDFDYQVNYFEHHPRVGRSMFFCKNQTKEIKAGLTSILKFYHNREQLDIKHADSEIYCANNISPRWLFQTMMKHLDEYIYFKDKKSRFLAVSDYLVKQVNKQSPTEVIGLDDYDFYDQAHADEAYSDELRLVQGQLSEINKEEHVNVSIDDEMWVATRKLPLFTKSNRIAGSFGLSRDITREKKLHDKLEQNHERMQSELLLAKNLQSKLMQQKLPNLVKEDGSTAVTLASKYIPSFHLSGDYYSVKQTACGGIAIFIADVMGHGVRASMVTAMIQTAVQELSEFSNQPAEFMKQLNNSMVQSIKPSGQLLFTTGAYCYLNIDSKQLTYVQAGAKHGILVPVNERKMSSLFKKETVGPALGLVKDVEYQENEVQLEENDEILLYTDGIIEAALGEEEFSERRLLDFLAEHRHDNLNDMMNALIKSVQNFTDSQQLDDDVCLVSLRLH
jgi:sigma-B regulation protein RsbU (phosphoserine phosphatase)